MFLRRLSTFVPRSVVYTATGTPSQVLNVLTHPPLPSPPPKTANIRYLLSPINPSDINVIEGVYPARPSLRKDLHPSGLGSQDQPAFVAGNEGLGEVSQVGEGVDDLKVGDWVVMVRPQAGTWSTSANVTEEDVIKIPLDNGERLSEVSGATLTVNPPTAFNMLRDFVDLKPGDWVVQNGANSAVGQAVIQICANHGIKTINLVRDREDISALKQQLTSLGATQVATYEEISDKAFRNKVKEWTAGAGVRLGLNCVSGPSTTHMARLLGQDAHLVSYGAMSKQPLSLPTSLFIFKNLTCHGFWQSRWYQNKGREAREGLMKDLVQLISNGKLQEPSHEILSISPRDSDEIATGRLREVIDKMTQGRYGMKVLLKFEDA